MASEIEVVRIPVEPARAGELIEALQQARRGYLAKPACDGVEVLLGESRSEVAVIVTWASPEAHALALQGPHSAQFFQQVAAFATDRPEVRKYISAGRLK